MMKARHFINQTAELERTAVRGPCLSGAPASVFEDTSCHEPSAHAIAPLRRIRHGSECDPHKALHERFSAPPDVHERGDAFRRASLSAAARRALLSVAAHGMLCVTEPGGAPDVLTPNRGRCDKEPSDASVSLANLSAVHPVLRDDDGLPARSYRSVTARSTITRAAFSRLT